MKRKIKCSQLPVSLIADAERLAGAWSEAKRWHDAWTAAAWELEQLKRSTEGTDHAKPEDGRNAVDGQSGQNQDPA